MAPSQFLDGFTTATAHLSDIAIHYAFAGTGPAILLLHGHPQTHVVWRKIAPQLVAAGYQVIAPDLRGYGDSEKPASDESHTPYSKRMMAQDQNSMNGGIRSMLIYLVTMRIMFIYCCGSKPLAAMRSDRRIQSSYAMT